MDNQLKHRTTFNKRKTSTKLLSQEYAIVNKNGEVEATTNYENALKKLNNGNQVYIIKTYQLQIKHELKIKEN